MRVLSRFKTTSVVWLSIAGLVLLFQNCTGVSFEVKFSKFASKQSLSSSVSGNGSGYDGKPAPGDYVRVVANGCPQSTDKNKFGLLSVTTDSAILKEDACVDVDYPIRFDDTRLQHSFYNPEFVGFKSAVFERVRPDIYSSAVDVMCSYEDSSTGLDLVIKSDLITGARQASLYIGDDLSGSKITKIVEPFPVQKRETGNVLSYISDEVAFAVDITSDIGHVDVILDGEIKSLTMNCRVTSTLPALGARISNAVAILPFHLPVGQISDGLLIPNAVDPSLPGRVTAVGGASASSILGPFGSALSIQDDVYVDLSGLAARIQNELTVSLWLLPNSDIRDDSVAFAINTATGSNLVKIGTGMCSGNGDRTRLTLEIRNDCLVTGINIVNGVWHLVGVTIANNTANIYLDGQLVGSLPFNSTLSANDLWSLGQDFDGTDTGNFWEGVIDEVIVWDSALSDADMAKLYSE